MESLLTGSRLESYSCFLYNNDYQLVFARVHASFFIFRWYSSVFTCVHLCYSAFICVDLCSPVFVFVQGIRIWSPVFSARSLSLIDVAFELTNQISRNDNLRSYLHLIEILPEILVELWTSDLMSLVSSQGHQFKYS